MAPSAIAVNENASRRRKVIVSLLVTPMDSSRRRAKDLRRGRCLVYASAASTLACRPTGP
jgi:hypothetical protein